MKEKTHDTVFRFKLPTEQRERFIKAIEHEKENASKIARDLLDVYCEYVEAKGAKPLEATIANNG